MNERIRKKIAIFGMLAAMTGVAQRPLREELSRFNIVWDSPNRDSFGSMPLGNGDVGLNVWVEENGDLVFYISKVDAFDAGHRLPKLGRMRARFARRST